MRSPRHLQTNELLGKEGLPSFLGSLVPVVRAYPTCDRAQSTGNSMKERGIPGG
jgi:hypothetical protein